MHVLKENKLNSVLHELHVVTQRVHKCVLLESVLVMLVRAVA